MPEQKKLYKKRMKRPMPAKYILSGDILRFGKIFYVVESRTLPGPMEFHGRVSISMYAQNVEVSDRRNIDIILPGSHPITIYKER